MEPSHDDDVCSLSTDNGPSSYANNITLPTPADDACCISMISSSHDSSNADTCGPRSPLPNSNDNQNNNCSLVIDANNSALPAPSDDTFCSTQSSRSHDTCDPRSPLTNSNGNQSYSGECLGVNVIVRAYPAVAATPSTHPLPSASP